MKFNETLARADEVLRERLRREEAELAAEDAAQRVDARAQARADAERRQEIAARYDPAFSAFNVLTPQPHDDESPRAYRHRLFGRLQRRLPPDHELATVRSDDLSGLTPTAYRNFEAMLLDAARQEGERPSFQNLPASGELVQRIRTDEGTGERSVNWYGRESFIKQMSRGGQRVLRVIDPRTRSVLMGPPFDVAPR